MREVNIISDLLKARDYLPIEYFIDKYSVSKRTLQNDFSYLTKVSLQKGFMLIQKRGKGYLIEINDEEKLNEFINYLKRINNKSKISIENIVAYILLQKTYVTIDAITREFNSSKSVINKLKQHVDKYLEEYNFTVERKAHYGVKIKEDLDKRKQLIIDLYLRNNDIVKKYVDRYIGNKFLEVKKALIEEFNERQLNIDYVELNEVLSWIKTTIYIHLQYENPIEEDMDNAIQRVIKKQYNITFYKKDIEELNELINIKAKNKSQNFNNINELQSNISEFLNDLDKKHDTSFNKDEDFKRLLTLHVSSLIDRLKFRVSYTNPIIDELSIKYAPIFNMAISFGEMLKEKYKIEINRDEIGFITTHFAVHMEKEFTSKLKKYNKIAIICSSGGGSAYLTKLKINSLFNKAIIETFSIVQIKEVEEFNPDIVFSTIEVILNLQLPLIYIKELLDDYDILKIKQLISLDKIHTAFISKTKDYYIKKFFNPKYFNISQGEKSYIKAIEKMAETIENDGIGGKDYKKLILKRESFSSTIYFNGVAIPHPMEMRGKKDLVFVNILKNPIICNEKKVNIIFMILLQKINLELYKEITQGLFKIMDDKKMVQNILKVSSFKEFIALISQKI